MMSILMSALAVSAAWGKTEVHGHRGARWVRPENTLPAFEYAVKAGVDVLEMDTHVTKDGIVVVTHDPTLNADVCADAKGARVQKGILIRTLTLKELQTYDCGAFANPHFPNQMAVPKTRIPTLDQVFDLVAELPGGKKVKFNIETKSEEAHPEFTPEPAEFVDMLLKIFRKHGVMSRVILQSFDYRTLKIAHEREPKLVLSVLVEDRPKEGLAKLAQQYSAQIISPDYQWLKAEDIKEAHAAKVQVVPWTVNDKSAWKRLMDWGIDGIITDNPKDLVEFTKSI
jgi:glycerophosphoryl diester phosphodiesterase